MKVQFMCTGRNNVNQERYWFKTGLRRGRVFWVWQILLMTKLAKFSLQPSCCKEWWFCKWCKLTVQNRLQLWQETYSSYSSWSFQPALLRRQPTEHLGLRQRKYLRLVAFDESPQTMSQIGNSCLGQQGPCSHPTKPRKSVHTCIIVIIEPYQKDIKGKEKNDILDILDMLLFL